MKTTMTKLDFPKIRRTLALRSFPETLVTRKWNEISDAMGSVGVYESIRGMYLVLYLVNKVETILVEDVALRGSESTMSGLDVLNNIKTEVTEILSALEN